MYENEEKDIKIQLIRAVLKKRACRQKAQKIVESLIERNIDEKDFLNKLNDIHRDQYKDIVDERSIQKYCGYPLCNHVLQKVPQKQYSICTSSNKVYDLTERKKFCSEYCYKASEYIQLQVLDTPLWTRSAETLPNYQLLEMTKN